jgi:hypothetical protein
MCSGQGCPLRDRCYRFRGVAHGRVNAFGTPPFDAKTQHCEQFWDIARLAPTEQSIQTAAYYLWVADGRPVGRADEHWRKAREKLEAQYQAQLRPLSAS